MKIRVGRIPYLNSEPFYYELVRDDVELLTLLPSAIYGACERGEVDAAPLPLADYFRLQDRFAKLGQFCIATQEKAASVLLYSTRRIEDLDGAAVGVTSETSTSKRLLEVLLTHRFEVTPSAYVSLDQPNDAFLLIGDEALRRRYGVPSYPYRYDLGQEWFRWTGMPFVFAVWVVKNDLPHQKVVYLENVLYSCIDEGLEHMHVIAENRQDVRMSMKEIVDYYRVFRYWAGVSELKAIERFRGYLQDKKLTGAA
jgi:chorismate dehydratase